MTTTKEMTRRLTNAPPSSCGSKIWAVVATSAVLHTGTAPGDGRPRREFRGLHVVEGPGRFQHATDVENGRDGGFVTNRGAVGEENRTTPG